LQAKSGEEAFLSQGDGIIQKASTFVLMFRLEKEVEIKITERF
jgi:hypothetical protein